MLKIISSPALCGIRVAMKFFVVADALPLPRKTTLEIRDTVNLKGYFLTKNFTYK